MSDEHTNPEEGGGEPEGMPPRLPPDVEAGLKAAYNDPPATPREAMWAEVERGLSAEAGPPGAARGGGPHRRAHPGASRLFRRRYRVGVAAAALFLLGLGVGRWTGEGPVSEQPPAPGVDGAPGLALEPSEAVDWRPWTVELAQPSLDEAEFLLSLVRADLAARESDPAPLDESVSRWAESLLVQTRGLVRSTEVQADPELRDLLEDLELILVQVVHAPGAGAEAEERRVEMELIAQGLDENDLLARLRTVAAQSEQMPFPEEET